MTQGRSGRPWIVVLAVVAAAVILVWSLPRGVPEPPLHLVALGADGSFRDTLDMPGAWGTATAEGSVRLPLVLGVRNTGERSARPERLSLSLPVRYRLEASHGEMETVLEAGSPLVTYTVATGLDSVPPGRLPTLLPALDTLWLEVVIPSYHCVTVGDSVPEFIPAPRPPVATLRDVRIFYSFEGGDLTERRTGTLTVRLDTTLLDVEMPDPPPSFPVEVDPSRAAPELGELRFAGSRRSQCGGPGNPMEIWSIVWLTEAGGRVILLEHGGAVRKRLYDLDDDGVVERESWDADGDGTFEATRRAELPIPEFLLPVSAAPTPGDSVPAPR